MAKTARKYAPELHHSLLSKEEVAMLIKRMQGDDPRDVETAFHELVTHNLRFVGKLASQYYARMGAIARTNIDIEDLRQEGYDGLMTAARKFDPAKGTFSTYAAWWIRKGIEDYLRTQSFTVTFPTTLSAARQWIYQAQRELAERGEKNPSDEDVAAFANQLRERERGEKKTRIEASKVRLLRKYDQLGLCSYDAVDRPPVADRSAGPEQIVVASEIRELLLKEIAALGANQATAIRYRFGLMTDEPLTQTEVGVIMGKSGDTIRRWVNDGLAALRARLGDDFGQLVGADLELATCIA